ncbi:MAG: hypothetical protein KF768_12430, partial [Phycisphaeraceae bacterium]|nr:hypothetical protein [Phycisphaeraceae bacterium]
ALTAILAGAALLAYAAVAFAISLLVTLGDVSAVHAVWMRFAPGAHASALPVDVSIGGRNGGGNGGGAGGTRWRVGACLCVVAVGSGLVAARLLETVRVPIGIEVTAHRGAARVAPENTLASIRAAAAMGADRVEFDVMQSADGGLVLFHDTDLRRIANDPRRVAGMTLEELRGIDAGSWFSAEFAGERIPTLEEALDEAVRGGIAVNMELKAAGDEETLAQRALAVLREHRNGGAGEEGAREWAIVTSLSAGTLAAVRREDPGARIGLIVTASVGDLRRADVDLLAVESRIATGRFVRRAKQAGLQVHVWGVTDPDQFTRLALQGVEGVITSEPGSLLVRRAELARLTEVERLLLAFRMRVLGH